MTLFATRTAAGRLLIEGEDGQSITCGSIEEMDRTLADLHVDQLPARTVFGWRADGRSAPRP